MVQPTITPVKIRATISVGGLTVKTPYILSFNVSKQRGSKSTFTASLKVQGSSLSNISDSEVTINAGTDGSERRIFTGYVLSSKPSPCWDDPNYIILNISGADVLYKLENKKFTRRQIDAVSKWASIDSVTRSADVSGAFTLRNKAMTAMSPDHIAKQSSDTSPTGTTKNKTETASSDFKPRMVTPAFSGFTSEIN